MSKVNHQKVSQGASIKTIEYKSMLLCFIEQIALQKQYHCLDVQNTLLTTFKGEHVVQKLTCKAVELHMARNILRGSLALYDL